MPPQRSLNRELLKVFYFVALFVALVLIVSRALVWFGVADRVGLDRSKHIAVLSSLLVTMLTFRLWMVRRKRRSEA